MKKKRNLVWLSIVEGFCALFMVAGLAGFVVGIPYLLVYKGWWGVGIFAALIVIGRTITAYREFKEQS